MLVAQRAFAHIGELDRSLGAGIHEPVATLGVELSGRDHFCQLLHVGGLYVDNVEALVLDVEVPEIYAQIVTADEGLAVAVYRNAVDVVGMGIGICPPRHGGDDCIVVGQPGKLQVVGVSELRSRGRPGSSSSAGYVCWC